MAISVAKTLPATRPNEVKTAWMNETEVNALFNSVAEGTMKLYDQSQRGGDDVSLNPARTLFAALSAYLADNEVLEAMNLYATYMMNPEAFPKYQSQPARLV